MDHIDKALARMSLEVRLKMRVLVARVEVNDLGHMDVKKLKGEHDAYRVRWGSFRVVFRKGSFGNKILHVGYRSDNTYR